MGLEVIADVIFCQGFVKNPIKPQREESRQEAEGRGRPPRHVVGRHVEHVELVAQEASGVRDREEDPSARLDEGAAGGEERMRVGHVLENLESANGAVAARLLPGRCSRVQETNLVAPEAGATNGLRVGFNSLDLCPAFGPFQERSRSASDF
jgi:hypothetical protein